MTGSEQGEASARPWWDRIPAWAVVLLVVAVYLPALKGGFIWDDDAHLTANPRMASWAGLVELWTSRWAVYYPLTSTTFWVLRRLFGLEPFFYHAFTLALHIASALLFARVLRGLRVPGAMLGALVFALHPLNVESVAWITELKNTQSLLFLMLSALFLIRSGALPDNQLRDWSALLASKVFFVCAVLSKPSVVMWPAVILVLLWWRGRARSPREVWWTIPFFVVSLLMAAWTIWEQRYSSGAEGLEWAIPFGDRLVTAARIATFYAGQLLWPEPLMFIYPSLRLSAAEPRAWAPLVAIVGAIICVAFNARSWGRPLLAAGAIFLLCLFPVLGFFNVYFMRYSEVSDHFAYLASLPACALAGACGAGLHAVWRRRAPRRAGWMAGWAMGALLMALGLLSWRHAHVFQSNERLWRDTVEKNPGAWMAQNNLGLIHWDRGEWPDAEAHFRAALAVNPRHYEALCNIGAVRLRRGRLAEARVALEEAIRWQPQLPQAWYNLGRVHEKTGAWDDAQAAFQRVLAIDPHFAEAHARLALRAEELGDAERALWHYRHALERATPDPRERAKYLNERAARFISRQQWPLARAFLDASLALDPAFEDTLRLESVWRDLLPQSPPPSTP